MIIPNDLNRRQKLILTGIILLAIYTIAGFVIIPVVARQITASKLSQALDREASIETVRLNPFTLSLEIQQFKLKQKDTTGDMVAFRSLSVNLKWASLFRLAPVVSHITLDTPVINISRNKQGVFNFSDLLGSGEKEPAQEQETDSEPSSPFPFSMANIEIARGSIVFKDDLQGKTHRMENMSLGVPFISTIGQDTEIFVMPNFSADIDGKPFSLDGRTKPFHETLETTINLKLTDLDLPYYTVYAPESLPVTVTSGALNLGLTISFIDTAGKVSALKLNGEVDLRDLAVADNHDRPLFSLGRLGISLAPSRILDGDVHLSAINLDNPKIHILRDGEGDLNIYEFRTGLDAEKPVEEQPTKDNGKNDSTFHVRLDTFRLSDAAVLLKDNAKSEAQTETDLAAEKIISLALLDINAVTVNTKTQEISVNEIRTKDGILLINRLADGTLNLQALSGPAAENKRTPSSNESTVVEQGPPWSISMEAIALNNYQVRAANPLSATNGNAIVALNALALTNISASSNPVALKIDDIHLNNLDAALRIDSIATLNSDLATKKEESTEKTELQKAEEILPRPEGNPTSIHVGRIALVDSRLQFADHTLPQPFHAELADINFEITNLSSRPDQIADILFSGLLNEQASLNISGNINPLAEHISADITQKFENMELSRLTPFSEKYIGRKIAKGKLFTNFSYTIKDQKLVGNNHVFIDQLALGEKVDSPDATKLPVQLAISLLQDRQGKIVLDVPVSGNLNDPKFRLGRVILQAFTNIVVKAATSPFSLVSAALGGADLSHLEFAHGIAKIENKLGHAVHSLGELLYNRPALTIELAGFVDLKHDKKALDEILFMRKLKARKHAQLPPEAQSTPVDNTTITPEEYEEYLWQAYKTETFAKPKNALGRDKRLPVEAIEALMRQHTQADETHLKILADQRARQVRDHILASGKVNPERVFVVEAPSLTPEPVKTVSNSRVDVTLK